MTTSRFERFRVALVNKVWSTFYGITLGQWAGLLRQHRFEIDPPYWPRAAFITLTSIATSVFARYEQRVYGPRLASVDVQPPVFILGHWRSGTTHLHNLLAVDRQFAYPNLYQVTNPQTFLASEKIFSIFDFLSPQTRLVDDVSFGFGTPQEDEFATCNMTLLSPYLGWAFPAREDYYERYLTFEWVRPQEVKRWQAALLLFLTKLTWKYDRRLVLKSPPHTCRIGLLLDLFPGARFVHIHRDPCEVFQSTRRLVDMMYRSTGLQHVRQADQAIDARIIRRYRVMYERFFEEQALIPEGQFHELSFEALNRDPMGQLALLYERLGLPGFASACPALERYLATVADYKPHAYPELPSHLRREIDRAWQQSFETWRYA